MSTDSKPSPTDNTNSNSIEFDNTSVSDYLDRLKSGKLHSAEEHVGESRRVALSEPNRAVDKDECPDENYPND